MPALVVTVPVPELDAPAETVMVRSTCLKSARMESWPAGIVKVAGFSVALNPVGVVPLTMVHRSNA